MNLTKTIILAIQFHLPFVAAAQIDLYVSPSGNDANNGTLDQPYRSIEKALNTVNKKKGRAVINLLEGTYFITSPISIFPQNSQRRNKPLVIQSYKRQKVSISSNLVLELKWQPYKKGIWQAKITRDVRFDELYVNGERQRMARYPNFDSSAKYYNGTADDVLSKERIQSWQAPEGGYIHALHSSLWGDMHYEIKGKNGVGELLLEGGWQNNRQMGMHTKYRFVENVMEELDTAHEWYFDRKERMLYFFPPGNINLKEAIVETPQLSSLVELKGTEANPVRNVQFKGISFENTVRTFMKNREPLLRSDWTIYRGAAILFDGAEDCSLQNCVFTDIGGNAVFVNNYNRRVEISGCAFFQIGASAVCFVGDPAAVRSPSFEYYQFVPLAEIDREPGPKLTNYPGDCLVFNNLIHDIGQTEKQSAGVQLSMCANITVRNNTIYDVPRAGINISEGTWGGHVIEYNDVFNTVKESGDHGSFNSWGRDRFWHFNKSLLDSIVENDYGLALLDVVRPIVIRNNRFRCDHGWDIDLDDGSSNYIIMDNLCLNGGIKLREGVNRIVENNIILNNTFHPHVWFRNSNDVFKRNIVFSDYQPVNISRWGKEVDYNVFNDSTALNAARSRGTDKHSVVDGLNFIDPKNGNFNLKKNSVAFSAGFRNIRMDNFGVVSPSLRRMAKRVVIPKLETVKNRSLMSEITDYYGATIKPLTSPGEQSATGMNDLRGLIVLSVKPGSKAASFLQVNDVLLSVNRILVNSFNSLSDADKASGNKITELIIFRSQKEILIAIDLRE